VIRVEHLTKQYGNVLALDDISFTVPQSGVVGLLGGNGAGNDFIKAVSLEGVGYIDDMVVTNGDVFSDMQWTVDAEAGAGGCIYPAGNVKVGDGDNVTFSITPDSGYVISEATVDGGDIDNITISDITMVDITCPPIFLRLGDRARGPGPPPPGTRGRPPWLLLSYRSP
jgi:ABC-type dipeptide/oligopeptide/nickel transport system ATPase component